MLNNDKDGTPQKKRDLCGIHVQQARLAHGLSLEDFQAAIQQKYGLIFTYEDLASLESGERVVDGYELGVIAHFFQVPFESFVWGTDEPVSKEYIREALKTLELPHERRSLRRGRRHRKKLLASSDKNAHR